MLHFIVVCRFLRHVSNRMSRKKLCRLVCRFVCHASLSTRNIRRLMWSTPHSVVWTYFKILYPIFIRIISNNEYTGNKRAIPRRRLHLPANSRDRHGTYHPNILTKILEASFYTAPTLHDCMIKWHSALFENTYYKREVITNDYTDVKHEGTFYGRHTALYTCCRETVLSIFGLFILTRTYIVNITMICMSIR